MAVEKMYLVNITSRLENLSGILEDVIKIGQIEPIDAFNQVASRAFSVQASSENVELTEDMNSITSFEGLSKESIEKFDYLNRFFELNSNEFDSDAKHIVIDKHKLDKIYNELEPMIKRKEELLKRKEELTVYKNNLDILDKAKIDISKIKDLNYFDYRYGEVSKDGRFILKNNYENIPSLIIHLDTSKDDKSIEALDDIIDLDKKTSIRRKNANDIIENESNESLKFANNIENKFNYLTKEKIESINKNYEDQVVKQSEEIKAYYSKQRNYISNLYSKYTDNLVDFAFKQLIKEDDND